MAVINNITYKWSTTNSAWTRSNPSTGSLLDFIQVIQTNNLTGYTVGVDIVFNTIVGGSGILYNNSTGVFTLLAGKTYELYGAPHWATFTDQTTPYVMYQWVDAITNTPISTISGIAEPLNRNTTEANVTSIRVIYTPSTNQTVKLRVTGASGTATLRGDVSSSAQITQVGSSSLLGNITIGGNGISSSTSTGAVVVQGGMGVSGDIYVGGNVVANISANILSAASMLVGNLTANTTFGNGTITATGNVSVGNISGANLITSSYFHGVFDSTSNNQPNITGLGTLTSVTVSGLSYLQGQIKTGTGSFTKTLGNGDIALDNGTTDTPGVLFYSNNSTNFGIDSYIGSGSSNYLRISKNLNEGTGAELVKIDTGANVAITGSGGAFFANQRKFSWSGCVDGDPRTSQQIVGVFSGQATLASSVMLDGIQLTASVNNQTGAVNWNVAGFDFTKDFVLNISFYQAAGADGIWFGVGAGGAQTGQPGTLNTVSGVVFRYLTFSSNVNTRWWVNNTSTGNTVPFHSGVAYTGAWQTAKLMVRTVGSKRYAYMYTGVSGVMDNAIDITSWTPGGTYIFVGASTGSVNAYHAVNHVSLEYI